MGLYDKYARLAGERLQFSDNGLTPFGTCIDEVYSATEGRIGNKKVILAGTNNYLGLTFNHDAIAEGQAALAAQGTGTTGSRMANGSYAPHLALEKEIAEFFNRPTAIVFSTGYTANLGVISTLKHKVIILLCCFKAVNFFICKFSKNQSTITHITTYIDKIFTFYLF